MTIQLLSQTCSVGSGGSGGSANSECAAISGTCMEETVSYKKVAKNLCQLILNFQHRVAQHQKPPMRENAAEVTTSSAVTHHMKKPTAPMRAATAFWNRDGER